MGVLRKEKVKVAVHPSGGFFYFKISETLFKDGCTAEGEGKSNSTPIRVIFLFFNKVNSNNEIFALF